MPRPTASTSRPHQRCGEAENSAICSSLAIAVAVVPSAFSVAPGCASAETSALLKEGFVLIGLMLEVSKY